MPRFSLSPVPGDDSDSENYDRNREWKSADHHSTSDYDDEETAEEPLHPLGFSTGRFALDANSESLEHYKRRWGYVYPFETAEEDSWFSSSSRAICRYPPLSNYLDPETAPTKALLRQQQHQHAPQVEHDTMDRLATLLQAASIVDTSRSAALAVVDSSYTTTAATNDASTEQRIQQEMAVHRQRIKQENLEAAKALAQLISLEEQKAQKIRQAQEKEQAALEKERQHQEKEAEAQRQLEQKEQDAADKAKDEAATAERERATKKLEQKRRIEREKKKEQEYLLRAKKIVAQLVQVRASVEPFEKSKALARRRLGMKKIVNGRVNTLAENAEKIKAVAMEVSQAISAARAEDEQIKQQLQANTPNVTPEMARGKRYLIDLLSSKVIVRAQAEGFNG